MVSKIQNISKQNKDMPPSDLKIIEEKLSVLSRALGVISLRLSIKRPKDDKGRILFLHKLGYDAHDIAAILNTTPGTVSVRLSEEKKKRNKRRNRRGKN